MHDYHILLVDERIEQLRLDAAKQHERSGQGSATVRRVGAAFKAVAAAITMPVNADYRTTTPVLDGYPYRG